MLRSSPVPDDAEISRVAAILNAGKKTVILAGQGSLMAGTELRAVAERLAAPIVKPLLGKGAVPDDDPFTTGGIGLLGTLPSQEAMESCDTLLIVGSSFPYIEFYPRPGSARIVQIDVDARKVGLRCPVEIGIVGDAAQVLRALLPHLQRRDDHSFLKKAQKGKREWDELMADRGARQDKPMKPQVVAFELNKLLSDDAIIATDSGTITTWAARHLSMRGSMMFSCSGNLASMACGLPYAIAAAIAFPERQVIAFVGDGGLTMLIGELATCIKYKLNIKVIVIKNNTLGQIKWEQMVFLGNPEYACDLQPIDFAAIARGFGIQGYSVDDPAQCAAVLQQALTTPGPALVEAVVDPHEPPMPPRSTLTQAAHLAESLARGTPEAGKIARTLASDFVRQII